MTKSHHNQTKRRIEPLVGAKLASSILLLGCATTFVATFLLPNPIPNKTLPLGGTRNKRHHPLADLSCQAYGGPDDVSEMVYWRDIPSDALYVSPEYEANHRQKTTKYLTFEPDKGGWNNVRMALETVLVMAHAMGRTLVLPPRQFYYLLSETDETSTLGLDDFLPLSQIAREQAGLEIITTDEFLRRERSHFRKLGQLPPHNRTHWDGMSYEIAAEFQPWLRSISEMPPWNPEFCVAVFPDNKEDAANVQAWFSSMVDSHGFSDVSKYFGKPTPLNATSTERLDEFRAGRNELCVYDGTWRDTHLLHFHGKPRLGGRLLTHFYSFLFFENWQADLWSKRFVRDHVRYADPIQCAAARIVQAVRARAFEWTGTTDFDAFHVRRGDFQYKRTRLTALELYNVSSDEISDGSVVYIATDETDKTFFDDLARHYRLVFLDDFAELLGDLDSAHYGMVDQLVTARSRVFFGCWFSTFSGYINRIRGYHNDKAKGPGYQYGLTNSYYYAPFINKYRMRGYWPLAGTLYTREFPTSWRDIDFDVLDRTMGIG